MAAGDATPSNMRELAARASPLRIRVGFEDRRHTARREAAAVGLIHLLRIQTEVKIGIAAGAGRLNEYAEQQELARQACASTSPHAPAQ